MVIYTKISKKDVVSIERKFNLGKITSFKGLEKLHEIILMVLKDYITKFYRFRYS